MKEYYAEKIVEDLFTLGEGPFYDARFNRLSWVDILEKKIHIMYDDNRRECIEVSQMVGAAVPLKSSEGFLAAMQDGLYEVNTAGEKLVYKLDREYESYERSNDAKADPNGHLFFGSSSTIDDEPSGNLFSYNSGDVKVQVPHTLISNGMAWSKDKKTFYFSDSPKHAVFMYDYDADTLTLSNERVLCTIDSEVGVPDGMTIDENDNIWLAVWGGNRVECHDGRTGETLAIVHVPGKQSSSCCFGGKDLDTLYITSAGVGLEGENEGGLFSCKVDVKGVELSEAVI